MRGSGQAEVPSQDVGLAILGPLRELDEVAYLRFASVYRSFTSADDFAAEIREHAANATCAAAEHRREVTRSVTAGRHQLNPHAQQVPATHGSGAYSNTRSFCTVTMLQGEGST